ncbi:MAG: hypothetical protein GY934_23830, partial [Gammaproteobacteria bacterium]|nr:hypothetical protein [Gammaproteobacteria bacterium]
EVSEEAHADPIARLLDLVDRSLSSEVGYQDYGDYRYLDGFANLEYDPAAAFLLRFLSGGNARQLILARDQLHHWVTYDRSRGEQAVPLGFPWMHGQEHRSLEYEAGHLWAGGLVLGRMITGESSLGRAVHELKQAVLVVCDGEAEFQDERSYGWALLALEDLLLIGADRELERQAAILARTLEAAQHENTLESFFYRAGSIRLFVN